LPAHIYFHESGIILESDGTLAGLQFELSGIEISDLHLVLQGYEFAVSKRDDKLTGIVFTHDNTPLPAGKIELFSYTSEVNGLHASEIIAVNVNANPVKVVKHVEGSNALFAESYEVSIYPNPSQGQFVVETFIPHTSETLIRLTDIMGRELKVIHNGILNQGSHRFEAGDEQLPSGLYFLQVQSAPYNQGDAVYNRNIKFIVK
jgi:hypothetical protein